MVDDLFPGTSYVQDGKPEVSESPDTDKPDLGLFGGTTYAKKDYTPQVEDDGETKSGDAWKAAKAGVQSGIVGPILAGGRDIAEKNHAENLETIFKNLGVSSKETAEEDIGEMSPAARKSLEASFADPEFWRAPLRGLGYKAANVTPGLAAVGAPALLFSGPIGATVAVAAANGALAGGSAAKDIYDAIDSKTDQELMQVPFYSSLRSSGASEEDARREYNQEALGNVPLINTIVGAAAGGLGPVAGVARAARGGAGSILAAGRSLPGRVAAGAAEAGGINAAQGGVENATVQNALVDNGLQKEVDYSQLGKSVADSAAIGVLTGGPLGVLSHGAPKAERPAAQRNVETVADKTPDAEQTAALAASATKAAPEVKSVPDVTPGEIEPAGERPLPTQVTPPVEEPLFAGTTRAERPTEEPAGALNEPAVNPDTRQISTGEERIGPEDTPIEEEPRAPRVLVAQDKEAKANLAAQKKAQDNAGSNLAEAEPDESQGKHYSAEERSNRIAQQRAAEDIFDASEPGEFPKTEADRQALRKRLDDALTQAKEAGIQVGRIKSTDAQTDHMVWLREAYDLKKTLDKKGTPPARRDEHITSFLTRELAAKGGDFDVMRTERKVEGEDIKNKAAKGTDVERVAAPTVEEAAPDITGDVTLAGNANAVGTEDVATNVAKSSKGPVRLKTSEGAASPVRKIELTPEERAKYETPGKPKVDVAAASKRLAEAAKKVERNPTEAQKESGNYAKGHVNIQGLPITIENPRGSVRRGVGPDGKPWEAKLPDHYGYIKRTEGADGDQVDVYVGKQPESKHVFVIDQVDPETKKFDEHKAMIGYKDAVDAMEAYEKSFSDGKGFDRIGKVTPMDVDGFKTWLKKGDTTKPAAEIQPSLRVGPKPEVLHNFAGEPVVTSRHTTTARQVLKAVNFDHLKKAGSPVSEKLIPFMRDQLVKMIGDTKIHLVSHEDMHALTHEQFPEVETPYGVHMPSRKGQAHDYIAINMDAHATPDQFVHTLMHEAVHAVTIRELHNNKDWVARIRSLMDEVHGALGDEKPEFAKYAFNNEREFVAEAMSNPHFQDLLSQIPISEYNAHLAGLHDKVRPTLWDFFVASISKLLRRFGFDNHSALEAVLRLTKDISRDQLLRNLNDHLETRIEPAFRTKEDVINQAREVSKDFGTNASGKLRAIKDSLSSTIMLGQRARNFLPGAERVVELRAMMERERHRILEKEGGLNLTREIADFEREHGSEAMQKLASLGFDASEANVNLGPDADNTHLGKDATHGWQSKNRLADLEARYRMMTPHEQALLQKVSGFFKKVQNDISLQVIKNSLDAAGIHDAGLAEKIHADGMTEADIQKYDIKTQTFINHLNEAREIKQIEGMYIPFRRYGDYVVNSYHEVKAPKTGLKIGDDTVQFVGKNGSDTDARRMARDYVADHDLKHMDTKKVWVDKLDPTKRLEAEDTNAVPAYQVKMQRQSTEFFSSEAEAKRVQAELEAGRKELGLEQVDGVRKRSDYVGHSADALSGQMQTVMSALEKQDRFKAMSKDQRDAVRQTINEASVRVLGSTRLQSTFLQRRNVAGYSRDLGRVTADYARAATGYLARLRFQPRLDAAFDGLKQYIDTHKFESSDRTVRRDELYNELRKRIYDQEPAHETTFGKVSKRLLQVSRLDKLAGVSFHVVNAQEPWTTALPVIGGRHGMIRAGRTMAWAYNLIGARRAALAGIRDTGAAFVKDNGFTDYLAMFKHEIDESPAVGGIKRDRLKEVIDYLDARDLYSDGAIFEVSKYSNPSSNIVGRSLDRADLMANQVGSAIEKINRTVTALSAYELEFARNGGNHEAAMHYAYEVTHDTMGDYASWNNSRMFKHPLGQLALQFRKFALKSYYLLGKTMQGAIAGDKEAAKQFIGLMVTHALVAGALGLPGLEPIKLALMASNALGVTGFTWDDFELAVREKAAEIAGAKGGEVISRGAYRAVGIEVSGRLGWDSLVTQPGGPRDPSKVNDIKAYLFDTFGGASASYLIDQMKSAQALSQGDVMKAIQLTVPLKGATDIVQAVTGQSEKLDAKGRATRKPYNAYDTAVRALGFTPSSEAENYAKRAQIAGQSRKQSDERGKKVNDWVIAKGADKDKQWRAIQEWNKTQVQSQRIQMKDLAQAQHTRAKNPDGLKETKRNANVFKRLAPIYAE